MTRILVVGAGPAGVMAAIAAKRRDPAAAVALLSAEDAAPYEKPPLSKAVLLGRAMPEDAPIVPPDQLAGAAIALGRGVAVQAIARRRKCVVTADGRCLPYDRLVLTTGGRLCELAVAPRATPGVHYLRDAADALALRTALRPGRRVAVVGAGLIGLEVAAASATLGLATTVLDIAPSIMARAVPGALADIIQARHEAEGISFRLGIGIVACQAGAAGIVLRLADGTEITADIVVVGVGVRPDDGLAREAGLRTDDGILVDENCRTSDPDIFAAGDATRFRHAGSAGFRREENWRHALDHGAIAGANAAGGDAAYRAVPSFWSEQYDLFIQGVGSVQASAGDPVRRLHGERKLIHFHMADDRIHYAVGIGAAKEMALARRIIERGIAVPAETLSDPQVNLAALLR